VLSSPSTRPTIAHAARLPAHPTGPYHQTHDPKHCSVRRSTHRALSPDARSHTLLCSQVNPPVPIIRHTIPHTALHAGQPTGPYHQTHNPKHCSARRSTHRSLSPDARSHTLFCSQVNPLVPIIIHTAQHTALRAGQPTGPYHQTHDPTHCSARRSTHRSRSPDPRSHTLFCSQVNPPVPVIRRTIPVHIRIFISLTCVFCHFIFLTCGTDTSCIVANILYVFGTSAPVTCCIH
jgi:hypothetical protein